MTEISGSSGALTHIYQIKWRHTQQNNHRIPSLHSPKSTIITSILSQINNYHQPTLNKPQASPQPSHYTNYDLYRCLI